MLLLPPWISRAATAYTMHAQQRNGAGEAVQEGGGGGSDNGSGMSGDDDIDQRMQDLIEIGSMAILQDLTVAACAVCLVLLPGLAWIRRCSMGGRAQTRYRSYYQRNHRRSGKSSPPSAYVAALALLLTTIIYTVFVLPIWLDLASQLLSGVRIRADYVLLTLANLRMFRSSMASMSASLWDRRVVVACGAALWWFQCLAGAVHTLANSSSADHNSKGGTKAKHSADFLRTTSKRLRLRCCVPPLPFLCSVAALYAAFGLAAMASLVVSQSSTANALRYSNDLFLVAAELVGLSFLQPENGFLQPSSSSVVGSSYFAFGRSSASATSAPEFIYSTERYQDLDRTGTYPFYRRTLGYRGPKAFDVKSIPNSGGAASMKKPNIVLIMMETWRHYDVGVLGGSARRRQRNRTATPHFDALARDGVLFDNFYANGIQTTRTLMSSLFGVMPQFGQAAAMDSPKSHLLNMTGIPSLLKAMGYNRTIFASATDLSYQNWDQFLPAHGFDEMRGLDWFEKRWHELNLTTNPNPDAGSSKTKMVRNARRRDLDATAEMDMSFDDDIGIFNETFSDDAYGGYGAYGDDYPHENPYYDPTAPKRTSWGLADEESFQVLADEIIQLSSRKAPFFLDFYSISSHHPFDIPASFQAPSWIPEEAGGNDEYRKYLEILSYSDQALGNFFHTMRERGVINNTIFIVAGDHGFGFCEHKPCFEGANIGNAQSKLYDVSTRVPFLIYSPDLLNIESRGHVIHEAASQVDLLPTIMDVVGPPSAGFPQHGIGRSLMRKVGAGKGVAPLLNTFNDQAIGLKRGRMKYVFEGSRAISVFNISPLFNNESVPEYFHRMQRRDDPPKGAPRDLLDIKDRVARILSDTNNCYKNNAFLPPDVELDVAQ